MESIVSYLNITDDANHGIEIAAIENKGRGIKVSRIQSSPSLSSCIFFLPGCEKFLQGRLCCGVLRRAHRHRYSQRSWDQVFIGCQQGMLHVLFQTQRKAVLVSANLSKPTKIINYFIFQYWRHKRVWPLWSSSEPQQNNTELCDQGCDGQRRAAAHPRRQARHQFRWGAPIRLRWPVQGVPESPSLACFVKSSSVSCQANLEPFVPFLRIWRKPTETSWVQFIVIIFHSPEVGGSHNNSLKLAISRQIVNWYFSEQFWRNLKLLRGLIQYQKLCDRLIYIE